MQNPDGGWGYFPGKASWLEPTVYSALALTDDPGASGHVERAWAYMKRLQRADGGWQPAPNIPCAHWATSLAVLWHTVGGVHDESFRRGLAWLLDLQGHESALSSRIIHGLNPSLIEYEPGAYGWPWRPGSSSWVEPTAHALFALKKAWGQAGSGRLKSRVETGERMLLDRRCADDAWNYGNRRVLGEDLDSFPETTALALHGLQGSRSPVIRAALERAAWHYRNTHSGLARAWLAIVLQNYAVLDQPCPECSEETQDVTVAALRAIGAGPARHLLALKGSAA